MNERTTALKSLLERIRANPGDQEAINELITAAADRIHRLAATILHGSFKPLRTQGVCLTDDVRQEALVRVWKPLAEARVNDVNHLFQLASVCIRSHLVDLARKKPPLSRVDVDVTEAETEVKRLGSDGDGPDYTALYAALDQLPEDQRLVLEYGEFHGLSTAEMAALLELPEYTVRRLGIRARKNLARVLAGPGSEEGSSA